MRPKARLLTTSIRFMLEKSPTSAKWTKATMAILFTRASPGSVNIMSPQDKLPNTFVPKAQSFHRCHVLFSTFLEQFGTDLARVQHCQQKINNLEGEAERARTENRHLMAEFSIKLKEKSRSLGQTLASVRPYFEARKQSIRRRTEADTLSTQYHQTIQMLKSARELVKLGY